jgi:hypothetical protein
VLDGVLGLLAGAEHVTAEGEDAGAMTLEGDFEGELVPAPDLLDDPLVAREREQALRPERPAGKAWCERVTGHRNAAGRRRFAHTREPLGSTRVSAGIKKITAIAGPRRS